MEDSAQALSQTAKADLADRAFRAWDAARRQFPEIVVSPSIPILYFGDLDAYQALPTRILTVGLNPSREEFPTDDPFRRFPRAGNIEPSKTIEYLAALNEYFVADPYRSWFNSFEPLLNGIDASFYPERPSRALHTDLCSPVATDPTWSGLDQGHREALIAGGRPLWHDLVRTLRPQVLLISVARRHLRSIEFPRLEEPRELYRIERSRPYRVKAWRIRLDADSESLVVFGRTAQLPFGTVSSADKQLIGQRIKEVLHR